MKNNFLFNIVISADQSGFIEYWDPKTFGFLDFFFYKNTQFNI